MSEGSDAMVSALRRLAGGKGLSEDSTAAAVGEIMSGAATSAQTGAFLLALRVKGETEEEIAGVARALRRCMRTVDGAGAAGIDTCGTGGDGLNTFNVSTATAFVVAGAGLKVAKHGNRSASSRCGSADVLEALGVPFLADPEDLSRCLQSHGMAFLYAPHLHPAMRNAAACRREIGVRTVFNLAGPLANPAGVPCQILGVPDDRLRKIMAGVLLRLGTRSAWVVTGHDGMDELTTTGENRVTVLADGELHETVVDGCDIGLPRARAEDLAGGDVSANANRLRGILDGRPGPDRDIVILNAAAALVVGGQAADLAGGREQAEASLDSGAASRVLQALKEEKGRTRGGSS